MSGIDSLLKLNDVAFNQEFSGGDNILGVGMTG
jgi:hypothetical protein